MSQQHSDLRPIYTIDVSNRLTEVNSAFVGLSVQSFDDCKDRDVIGRPIWDFVSGAVPRQLWEVLYARIRALRAPVFVPLRADTAVTRNLIDLELHPLVDGSIRHVRECVLTETRAAIALLDPNYPRDSRTLTRCAWCARIQVRLGLWQEIEEAQVSLRIEAADALPAIQDSACATCTQSVLKTFPARVA